MSRNNNGNYIHCFYHPILNESPEEDDRIDVFFSEACNIEHSYSDLRSYITAGEQSRADRFHFEADRKVYVLCHALLRLVLSSRLSVHPLDLDFSFGFNNKPFLPGNPLYFNLTHTKEAFAFAVSKNFYVGIDLENIHRNTDFNSVARNCFNRRERQFINELHGETRERFFLLWTRKEAFLKAIGTGIMFDLKKFGTSGRSNPVRSNCFSNSIAQPLSREHFIYSTNLSNHCLSVALPDRANIKLNRIDRMNLESFLLQDFNH